MPPEPDPALEAPPDEVPPLPVVPPFELLLADAPPELAVVPPDLLELLLALAPPDDPLAPPLRLLPPELEVPPELEAPPELETPPELLPPDEPALLFDEPSEDDAPPDEARLDPPCPLELC